MLEDVPDIGGHRVVSEHAGEQNPILDFKCRELPLGGSNRTSIEPCGTLGTCAGSQLGVASGLSVIRRRSADRLDRQPVVARADRGMILPEDRSRRGRRENGDSAPNPAYPIVPTKVVDLDRGCVPFTKNTGVHLRPVACP